MNIRHRISLTIFIVLLTFFSCFTSYADTAAPGPGVPDRKPEQELFTLINDKRAEKSLTVLQWDEELAKVAKLRASEIAVSYGHTRPDGQTPQTAYKEAGVYFSHAGENLAKEFAEPADVFTKWYTGGGSRGNLLRAEFTHAAVAYFDRPNEDGTVTRFWVMEFMKPKSAPVEDIPDTDVLPEP